VFLGDGEKEKVLAGTCFFNIKMPGMKIRTTNWRKMVSVSPYGIYIRTIWRFTIYSNPGLPNFRFYIDPIIPGEVAGAIFQGWNA
jgi:hypothetical protein